jgi:hypothetical protein
MRPAKHVCVGAAFGSSCEGASTCMCPSLRGACPGAVASNTVSAHLHSVVTNFCSFHSRIQRSCCLLGAFSLPPLFAAASS